MSRDRKEKQRRTNTMTKTKTKAQWRRSDAQRQSGGGVKGRKRDKVQKRRKGKS